jgi:hypothetical protein|tara:strand:+ start:1175 stop:1537 length:363 start_codon:yes stop_codon:yes gene_type:complete
MAISFNVFDSMHRDKADAHVKAGDVVVYNMGLAIREIDELGHTVPIGHFGCVSESNPILEKLVEAGLLNLISGGSPKKSSPKKKAPPAASTKATGYNPDARDGDGDGLVQDGTEWEREAK